MPATAQNKTYDLVPRDRKAQVEVWSCGHGARLTYGEPDNGPCESCRKREAEGEAGLGFCRFCGDKAPGVCKTCEDEIMRGRMARVTSPSSWRRMRSVEG